MVLREISQKELGVIAAWELDPGNAPFIVPWDEARHREALRDPDLRYFILDEDGRAVGFVLLAGITSENNSVEFRRIVVVEKGRGFGRTAVELVQVYCFENLGAHRLWLDVVETNRRARTLYESAGFRTEGILRDALKQKGTFHSLVVMSMLSSEYACDGPARHPPGEGRGKS